MHWLENWKNQGAVNFFLFVAIYTTQSNIIKDNWRWYRENYEHLTFYLLQQIHLLRWSGTENVLHTGHLWGEEEDFI